jgi:hypothetical protein
MTLKIENSKYHISKYFLLITTINKIMLNLNSISKLGVVMRILGIHIPFTKDKKIEVLKITFHSIITTKKGIKTENLRSLKISFIRDEEGEENDIDITTMNPSDIDGEYGSLAGEVIEVIERSGI